MSEDSRLSYALSLTVDWESLLLPKIPLMDVVLRTVCIYVVLQASLRVLGRKNLQHAAPYNVVTLFLIGAFGGRAVLGEDTSMTACALGLMVVLVLNALTSWAVYVSPRFAAFIEGPAKQVLVSDGRMMEAAMRTTRCSKDMLLSQLRSKGEQDIGKVTHAYMERTGEITFIFKK